MNQPAHFSADAANLAPGLLIDVGNTRIKWAVAAPGAPLGIWQAQGLLAHTLDQAAVQAAAKQWQAAKVGVAWIANVAGSILQAQLQASLQQALGPDLAVNWFASSAFAAGLRNGYSEPSRLGCDRFAAAIAARARYPQQAILVANCGTATTLDAISPDGVFMGGMILPGLGTMATSLNRQTAQLPDVDYARQHPQQFLPQLALNTDSAIMSGCIAAQIGAIGQGLSLLRARFGDALCILSGGAAPIIGAALLEPHQVLDGLVLQGLQVLAGLNARQPG
ncbi:MAG: hypothetical protein RL748_3620 [Pseudomonadota bacterium]|jgi:type III pantothenate kinase